MKNQKNRVKYTGFQLKFSRKGRIKMNRLDVAIAKAETSLNKADLALQNIIRYIKFTDFEHNDEPNISSCNGSNEIILEWHGSELNKNQIIYEMRTKGFIEPNDFVGIRY